MKFTNENMRKALNREEDTVTFFAWFPVTIGEKTRWLEKVTVKRRWFYGSFTDSARYKYVAFVGEIEI